VNPYVSAGLVMCGILLVSLAATAYLAVTFNRRAKQDLAVALAPLTSAIDGESNVDEATVHGRFGGHLVEGRMANASDGPGREFRTELIDSAGGNPWLLTSDPPRRHGEPPVQRFESGNCEVADLIKSACDEHLAAVVNPMQERFRLDYDPAAGRLRFVRPMRTRRDIPDADAFRRQLTLLLALGQTNRRAQGAPDADLP
jgi:hypothetical protein